MLQKYVTRLSSQQLKMIAACASACLYAGWVLINNINESLLTIIAAVCFQWMLSFFSTLFFSQIILLLVNDSNDRQRITLAAVAASLIYLTFLWGGHFLTGTANLIRSLMPISLVAVIYAFVFAYSIPHLKSR